VVTRSSGSLWRYDGAQPGGGHVGEHNPAGWYILWLKMRVLYMSVLELIRDVSTAETMASQSALAPLPLPRPACNSVVGGKERVETSQRAMVSPCCDG
jgi:hypothetical protein